MIALYGQPQTWAWEDTESMAAMLSGRWCEAAASQHETEELETAHLQAPLLHASGLLLKGTVLLGERLPGRLPSRILLGP